MLPSIFLFHFYSENGMKQIKTIGKLCISAMLFLSVLGCSTTDETAGNYIDDTVITTKVKTALFNEKDLKSSQIKVETFKGKVQLSGFVSSAKNVEKAVEAARHIKGVKIVINNMIIR